MQGNAEIKHGRQQQIRITDDGPIPELVAHPYRCRAQQLAEYLSGYPLRFSYGQVIAKPAHYNARVQWHQDGHYWQRHRAGEAGISCWIALTECNPRNGSVGYVTGSHRTGINQHTNAFGNYEFHRAFEVSEPAPNKVVHARLAPGDAAFHHSLCIHGSSGNQTDQPRIGIVSHFFPASLFVDGTGNLYISDTLNHRIRKVDEKGIISTIVGIGVADFFGDGGPANQAALRNPLDVFVDSGDNLYISDTLNHRIRKVDRAGIITTVARNGKEEFSGDGSPATEASLNFPTGIFVDALDNLYIVDARNHRLRKVDPLGIIITTVAGNGKADFSGDGGPATEASLNFGSSATHSSGVFVDALGNLYIADAGNHRIRKVAASLKIGLSATPAAITADGVETAVIQAQILNAEEVLLTGDNTTRVRFDILEGEGTLSAGEARVRDGIVKIRLVSQTTGTVIVQVSAPDILSVTVSVVVKPNVSPEMIRASDFNGDGKIEFADFLAFVPHFGQKPGDADYDLKFDLDGDQEIGFADFLIFAQSFGQSVDSAG